MSDATERWTTEQFRQYRQSGLTPEARKEHAQAVEKRSKQAENALQSACECLCEQRGYRRLVGPRIESALHDRKLRGFYGHITNAKRNAFMPDLFIYDLRGRCLMIELKVRNDYQPGQREMIAAGLWIECRTAEQFGEVLSKWESERNKEPQT